MAAAKKHLRQIIVMTEREREREKEREREREREREIREITLMEKIV